MMADSRNDVSPTKRENKYLILTSQSSDERGRVGSPMSTGAHPSPLSNASTPQKQLMTESEISTLVKDALVRARQATKKFSAHTQGSQPMSPRSEATTPTRNNVSRSTPTHRPPVYSPKSSSVNRSVTDDSDAPSDKVISVPSLNDAPVTKQSTLAENDSEEIGEEMSMQSIVPDPSMTSIGSANSPDNIIRRVEEEIANARRAAKEATRRLAGVSANFFPEAQNSNPRIPKNPDRVSNLDEQLDEMMATNTNGSASTDEDGNFDSALDLIGEEFDEIISGSSHHRYFAEEKKAEDLSFESRSSRLSRNRSIEECALDYVPEDEQNSTPEDERNTTLAGGTWESTGDPTNKSIEIKTDLNNDPSFDDFPHLYELEAVLSDEREQDILAAQKLEKTKSEYLEKANTESFDLDPEPSFDTHNSFELDPEPSFDTHNSFELEQVSDDKAAPVDEDENEEENECDDDIMITNDNSIEIVISKDDSIEPTVEDEPISSEDDEITIRKDANKSDSITASQEIADVAQDSIESENPSIDEAVSIDQVEEKEEPPETRSQGVVEKLDHAEEIEESTSDQLTLSPKISSIDTTASSYEEPMIISPKSVNKSVTSPRTEDEIPDSPDQRISVPEPEKHAAVDDKAVESKISIKSPVVRENTSIKSPVARKNNWFKDDDDMLTLNASKDESKIESVISPKLANDIPAAGKGEVSQDQVTEIAENKKSSITDRLLNDYLKTQISADLSSFTGSPSKRSTLSKDTAGSIFNFDNVAYGGKVTFKQRYPVPQKIKQSREPAEIVRDNKGEEANKNLWASMPKAELKELLEAVTGSSIQRRSNACGTLKVLSTQKKNMLMLVRTKGFMDAVVFAISDNYSIEDMEAGAEARTRAVNVVLNVSTKKDNRYHVLMHPGLRESLVKCMVDDNAEARELACATFATLAKSSYCREPMVKTENLVNALANILKKNANSVIANLEQKETDYSGDDEFSRDPSASYSHSSASSSLTRETFETDSRSVESQKEDPETRRRTRMNACAVLMHLSKECSVSQELCANNALLTSLVSCCREVHNPIHTKCLEILANLTRFPHNNERLVQFPDLVDAMLYIGNQEDDTDRLWSMRILQNLSADPTAKPILATANVLELLSTNMMGRQYGEILAATSAMYNISTEPGAVVPLTNTKNVVATLVHVAHSPASMMEVRTIACDALSTLGLWLQTLSSSGVVPEGVRPVSLPSYITSGWQRWDE